jgi:hypothetical protein
MKSMRRFGPIAAAASLTIGLLGIGAAPVAAECTYIPPLPKISMAIPTARELFVGKVIRIGDNGDGDRAIFRVRIEEVLRGPVEVGEVRDFAFVAPNWPWSGSPGGHPYPSCNSLLADLGETVALALDARWPGGTLHDSGVTWYQPPTTFQTIAVIVKAGDAGYDNDRQKFSLERLRELAALFPPATDTLAASAAGPAVPPGSGPGGELAILAAAGFLGALGAWRRTRRWPHLATPARSSAR